MPPVGGLSRRARGWIWRSCRLRGWVSSQVPKFRSHPAERRFSCMERLPDATHPSALAGFWVCDSPFVERLLAVFRRNATRHRLDALSIAGSEQATHVERRPLSLSLVPECLAERLDPTCERLRELLVRD